jgi:hypothetical protein
MRPDLRGPLTARIAEPSTLMAQSAGGRRSGQSDERAVDFGQQSHIRGRLAPLQGVGRSAVALDPRLMPHPAQEPPGYWREPVPAEALQGRQNVPRHFIP